MKRPNTTFRIGGNKNTKYMERPEINDDKYWDGDRFRHLVFIEELENYISHLEQSKKH